jgi:hypothetical protein
LNYPTQVLGIFIRDVTTPLLSRQSGSSSSTMSLPMFFEGNGQPEPRREGRMSQLKSFGGSWRRKSQDTILTLSAVGKIQEDEESQSDISKEFKQLALKEIDLLSPFLHKAEEAGQGLMEDLPLRLSKTPPPLPPRPSLAVRIPSSASVQSMASESAVAEQFPAPPKKVRSESPERIEDPSSRMKRVENWKRRLSRSRERLLSANCEVEIWTWRVGSDVERTCETLVMKALGKRELEYNGIRKSAGIQNGMQLNI